MRFISKLKRGFAKSEILAAVRKPGELEKRILEVLGFPENRQLATPIITTSSNMLPLFSWRTSVRQKRRGCRRDHKIFLVKPFPQCFWLPGRFGPVVETGNDGQVDGLRLQ